MDILGVSRTIFTPFDGPAVVAADAASSFTVAPAASSGVARPVSAPDGFAVTPAASGVVSRVDAASSSLVVAPASSSAVSRPGAASDGFAVTPDASSSVARPASASSSFTVTPSGSSAHAYPVSASGSFVVAPHAAGGLARPVAASSLIRFSPEPLAGFGWSVAAASLIVLTPHASALNIGPRRVSAGNLIVLTPTADELFAHGILADAASLIVLTPHASQRTPGPIFADATGLIVLTPSGDGGLDIRVGGPGGAALDIPVIVVTPDSSAELTPESPRDRPLSAADRIVLSPRADAIILRQGFDELGRYRRGDKVVLGAVLPGVPDSAPIAVVFAPDGTVIGAWEMPISDSTRVDFAVPVQINLAFAFGTYRVSYQFAIGGVPGIVGDAEFQVIPGGDSGGEVISLYSFDRPEARFVVAQLDSGRVVVGRNPSAGGEA